MKVIWLMPRERGGLDEETGDLIELACLGSIVIDVVCKIRMQANGST